MKIITSLFFLLVFPFFGLAQNSFSTIIEYPPDPVWENPGFFYRSFTGDENGNMYLLGTVYGIIEGPNGSGGPFSGIIKLDSAGNFQNFNLFGIDDQSFILYYGFTVKNNIAAVICRATSPDSLLTDSYLVVLDYENDSIWSRKVADFSVVSSLGGTLFGVNDQIVYSQFATEPIDVPLTEKLGVASADVTTGQVLWNRHFNTTSYYWLSYLTHNYTSTNNQDISILVGSTNLNSDSLRIGQCILQLSPDGELIKSYGSVSPDPSYNPYEFIEHKYDSEGNVTLAGIYRELLPSGSIKRSGFIAKYNSDFELIWAKILAADFFYHHAISIQILPTDEIVFSYSTIGEFPVIIGRLSKEGILEQYQGYAGHNARVYTAPDKSLYVVSGEPSDPSLPDLTGPLMIKTDPNGDIEGCPQYEACLELIDFELHLEPWDWEYEDVDPLPMVEPERASLELSTIPYCYNPPSPLPGFVLPDSICYGECLIPEDVRSQLANHSQFQITGPALDSVIIDTTFHFCFDVPGTYIIEQEVWVLGCSDAYSHELVVLPDLEIALDTDSLVCEDLPFTLGALSNRPVTEYLWSDNSTDSEIAVVEDGAYWLLANDGYCWDSTGMELELVQLQLTEPIFILPEDTSICVDQLPYALEVSGTYSDEFYNIESTSTIQPFMLNETGNYHIQTQVNGCTFDANYHLTVSPCLANVFVPNAFSPNGDGVNDWLEVYGPEIRVLELSVFDRWGEVVYKHQGAGLVRWDGSMKGEPVSSGVFVVYLEYVNINSGSMHEYWQSVTLIR